MGCQQVPYARGPSTTLLGISAIEDFKRYRADPLNFKVGITPKPKLQKAPAQSKETSEDAPAPASQQPMATFLSPSELEIVLPIPIRPNVIVKIVGIPSDLTKEEAARIANIVNAFATVSP